MKESNNGVTDFQWLAYAWFTMFLLMMLVAIWHSVLANVDFLSFLSVQASMFLAVFGIRLVGIPKAQNKRINAQNMRISGLEEELLRLTTPSPFAHVLPMTNDE
jgi:hypothetical protein